MRYIIFFIVAVVSCWSHIAGMDTSGSPVPDAIQPLLEQLQLALVLEAKYQPNLQLPSLSQVSAQTENIRLNLLRRICISKILLHSLRTMK